MKSEKTQLINLGYYVVVVVVVVPARIATHVVHKMDVQVLKEQPPCH